MQVINATIDHVPELAILFDQYRLFYRQPSALKNCNEFLSDRINGKESIIYIVIDSTDKIIGFTQLYPIFSSTRLKRAWLLNDLYVLPESRGRGVSKMLLLKAQHCIETGSHGIILETEKSNTIGNQLYPSAGFKLCNESINYYEWNPS